MQEGSYAGLRDLVKTSIPLVSQVGAVTGGLVSLLAAFEKVSGELTMALAGFMLVAAAVSSGIVIWGKTTRDAELGKNAVAMHLFSKAHRRTAAIALAVSIVLLIMFLVQVGVALSRPSGVGRFGINPFAPGTGPGAGPRATRPTPGAALAPPFDSPPPNPEQSAVLPSTTVPAAPSPIVGVATFVTQGFAALARQDYTQALDLFDRALQVDATSARAQLGLGESYYLLDDYKAAIPPLRLALQLNAELNEAHAYLGFAYESSQDAVRARAEYEEFLRVSPADSPLRSQVEQRSRRNVLPSDTPLSSARPTITTTATLAGY
jgi:hypothetical protein